MEKKTIQQYNEIIDQKKWDAHNQNWLYIEINAKALLEEVEPKVNNLTAVCKAMLEKMLEGDGFIVEPKIHSKVSGALTVRYYCDNLSPERRSYWEVQ